MGRPKKQKKNEPKYLPILFSVGDSRVVQSNVSIQRSYGYGNISLTEFKIVCHLMSKVRPEDPADKVYSFNCGEFLQLIGSHDQSFTRTRRMIKNIADASWWMPMIDEETGEEKLTLMRFLNIVDAYPRSGIIKVSFHERMYSVLRKTDENQFMSSFKMRYIARMSCKPSPLLYRLLNSYKNNRWWTFEYNTGTKYDILPRLVECFNEVVKIPSSWKRWANFKHDVLDKAVVEINEFTDLYVNYVPLKKDLSGHQCRGVVAIKFFIDIKDQLELDQLDERYMEMAEEDGDIASAESVIVEERKQQIEYVHNLAESNFIYPTLLSELSGFSEKQVLALADAARLHLEPGKINMNSIELWLCDYIGHYHQIVDATSDDTKTSIFRRLYDMVRKDYDSFAVTLNRYDKKNYIDVGDVVEISNEELTEKFANIRKNLKVSCQ